MTQPALVFLAGPNGAGKSTFYECHLRRLGLPFVNADYLVRSTGISNKDAANGADALRQAFLEERKTFITETVFSDPAGAKLGYLRSALDHGYAIRLIYVGLSSPALSEARVIQRVLAGGHDVPSERLARRYQQSLLNLHAALAFLPDADVYDNSDFQKPYCLICSMRNQQRVVMKKRRWFRV